MNCTLIRLDPHVEKTVAKIKDLSHHGDLVAGKNIDQSGVYVVYKINGTCDLLKCDNMKYFPKVCNVIPSIVTKHIKNPYEYYKMYFKYIQEINLDPVIHRDIIKQYVEPNLKYEYTFDEESFYVTKENGFIDSYNIKTFKLEHSNIQPFTGW